MAFGKSKEIVRISHRKSKEPSKLIDMMKESMEYVKKNMLNRRSNKKNFMNWEKERTTYRRKRQI